MFERVERRCSLVWCETLLCYSYIAVVRAVATVPFSRVLLLYHYCIGLGGLEGGIIFFCVYGAVLTLFHPFGVVPAFPNEFVCIKCVIMLRFVVAWSLVPRLSPVRSPPLRLSGVVVVIVVRVRTYCLDKHVLGVRLRASSRRSGDG